MSVVQALVYGVGLGVAVVLGTLAAGVALMRWLVTDEQDEELLVAVRRLLLDPRCRDAEDVVGDHVESLREIVLRRDEQRDL